MSSEFEGSVAAALICTRPIKIKQSTLQHGWEGIHEPPTEKLLTVDGY